MAATIAKCTGYDSTREKSDHRLGSQSAEGQANTYRTFTTCYITRDGSGYVQVTRGDQTIRVDFEGEDKPLPKLYAAPETIFDREIA